MNSNGFNVNSIYPKTNQGFLWNISSPEESEKSTHVLCMEGHAWENPLNTNPKVKEVFQNAETLYLEYPPLENIERIEKLWEVIGSTEMEENLGLLPEIKSLASGYLSKIELSPLAKEIHEKYELLQERTIYQDVLAYVFIVFVNHYEARCGLSNKSFFDSLNQCGKEVHFLQSEEEYLTNLQSILKVLSASFFQKSVLLLVKQLFKNENLLDAFLRDISLKYNSWNQGDIITHGEKFPITSSELIKELDHEFDQMYPGKEEKEQIYKEIEDIVSSLDESLSKNRKSLLDRISGILHRKRRSIVVINSQMNPTEENGIVSVVNEMGLKIQQVTIPMKPVGFFWKLKDSNGHKAYLLGTMHLAPKDLVNLNSKIQRCFKKSQAVGVEVDVTRQDVIEFFKNHQSTKRVDAEEREYFESQKKEIKQVVITSLKLLAMKKGLMIEVPETDNTEYNEYLTYKEAILRFSVAEIGYESGIELDLIPKAKESGKIVHDLETLEHHLGALDEELELMKAPILQSIINTVLEVDNAESIIEEMFDSLKKSLKNALDRFSRIVMNGYTEMIIDHLVEMPNNKKRYFNKRNLNIASKIDDLVQDSGKRFFFMVGAMHFPGEHGLVKLLEGLGYTAQRVIVEEPL